MKKNFALLAASIFLSLLVIELILSYHNDDENIVNDYNFHYSDYSKEELDEKLPFRRIEHGNDCIVPRFSKKMQWHSRIGYNDKELKKECIDNLFKQKKLNIIFMGGSGMANYETPNYLTSIENYLKKFSKIEFNSINIAEGGGRMSNNLSSFIENIPKLTIKPNYIVFLDGYNEFTPIIYGGDPSEDFYFTTTVKKRIHQPINYLFLKMIEQFQITKFIFYNFFQIESNRLSAKKVDIKKVRLAAEDYLYRKKIIEELCSTFDIKCIFFLQPIFHLSKNLNGNFDKKLKIYEKKYFPSAKIVFEKGYKIIEKNTNVYNLSNIFDDKKNIYIDMVHFNKKGSYILAKKLGDVLIEFNKK